MARPERAIQAAVLQLLRAHGVLAWGVNRERASRQRASHIGFPGHPDIAGVLPGGRALFLEVKRPGIGVTTLLQTRALQLLQDQGAVATVVRSVEDAQCLLEALRLR